MTDVNGTVYNGNLFYLGMNQSMGSSASNSNTPTLGERRHTGRKPDGQGFQQIFIGYEP